MEYKKIADRILDTYEKNLFSLSPKYQSHFAVRVLRVKDDERYLNPILVDFQSRTLTTIPRIKELQKGESPKNLAEEMLESYVAKSEKKRRRLEVYKKKPEIYFYLKLIHYLFLAKSFNLDKLEGFSDYFEVGVNHLKTVNLEEILFYEDLVEHNPSPVANSVYYLEYLGVGNLSEQLLDTYRTFWSERKANTEVEWQNKIYALTHLIIAASYFYQRYVEKESFSWILDFFERDFDEIAENTNPDIVAEVGLCFRLCGQKDHEVVKKAKDFVSSSFDEEKGYIPKENNKESLEKAEHRNIITVLLMADYDEFNQGPDLLSFMRKKRLTLYLPNKVEEVRLGQ